MPRHSPYALVRLNLTFASSSLYELLEFHKTNNCYSVSLFSEKVLSFSFSIDYSTFRWNCNFTQIGKTINWFSCISLNLNCPLICSFLTLQYSLFGFQWTWSKPLLCLVADTVGWWAQTRITLQRTASYMRSMERFGLFPRNFRCAWWAQVDSNHRPRAYQARALTTWAMSPCKFFGVSRFLFTLFFLTLVFSTYFHLRGSCSHSLTSSLAPATCRWWRWWESNPWPPACRAGALPAELHPHVGFNE